MGIAENFDRCKLVIGILSTRPEKKELLRRRLVDEFGPIDFESGEFDFTFTDYYNPEMGKNIKRYFYSFSDLVNPENLSDIKLKTNEIESVFAEDSLRKINIDPGILSLSSFILATTKNNVHRIPLQKGIYGEVTLMYAHKQFQLLPWTYADYQCTEYHKIFEEIRKILKRDLKQK